MKKKPPAKPSKRNRQLSEWKSFVPGSTIRPESESVESDTVTQEFSHPVGQGSAAFRQPGGSSLGLKFVVVLLTSALIVVIGMPAIHLFGLITAP